MTFSGVNNTFELSYSVLSFSYNSLEKTSKRKFLVNIKGYGRSSCHPSYDYLCNYR